MGKVIEKGDKIRLRRLETDEWTAGIVDIASPNGEAIMVVLDGPIRDAEGGMYLNAIPLIVNYAQSRVFDFNGTSYFMDLYKHEDYEIEAESLEEVLARITQVAKARESNGEPIDRVTINDVVYYWTGTEFVKSGGEA